MRDPHVESLQYKIATRNNTIFVNCEPLHNDDFGDFTIDLNSNILTFKMKKHFETIDSAKSEIEELLHTWEIESALKSGTRDIQFEYINAELIDRNPPPPPPPGSVEIHMASAFLMGMSLSNVTVSAERTEYPPIPTNFLLDADVKILWTRYEMYLDGKDQLLSMGYFCLTVVQELIGKDGNTTRIKRAKASEKLLFDIKILNKLGDLASEHGDEITARKLQRTGFRPLNSNEIHWIEECLRNLIHRVGEYKNDPSKLTMITMDDLPPL